MKRVGYSFKNIVTLIFLFTLCKYVTVLVVPGGEIQNAAISLALCNSGTAWCSYEVPEKLFTLDDGRPYTVAVALVTGEVKLVSVALIRLITRYLLAFFVVQSVITA